MVDPMNTNGIQARAIRLEPLKDLGSSLDGRQPIVVFTEQGDNLGSSVLENDELRKVCQSESLSKHKIGKILCLIECSNSMNRPLSKDKSLDNETTRFDYLKNTLTTLCQDLIPQGELILVPYNESAEVIDADNLTIDETIKSLKTSSGTNLSEALSTASNILESANTASPNKRNLVLLFTDDYKANPNDDLTAEFEAFSKYNPLTVVFGLGPNHALSRFSSLAADMQASEWAYLPDGYASNEIAACFIEPLLRELRENDFFIEVDTNSEYAYSVNRPSVVPAKNGISRVGYRSKSHTVILGESGVDPQEITVKSETGMQSTQRNVPVVSWRDMAHGEEIQKYTAKIIAPALALHAYLCHDLHALQELSSRFPKEIKYIDQYLDGMNRKIRFLKNAHASGTNKDRTIPISDNEGNSEKLTRERQPTKPPTTELHSTGTPKLLINFGATSQDSQLEQLLQNNGNKVTVGRGTKCTIQIADSRISEQHFQIEKRGNAFYLEDLGSQNGTWIDGVRRYDEVLLTDEMIIVASDISMHFGLN